MMKLEEGKRKNEAIELLSKIWNAVFETRVLKYFMVNKQAFKN